MRMSKADHEARMGKRAMRRQEDREAFRYGLHFTAEYQRRTESRKALDLDVPKTHKLLVRNIERTRFDFVRRPWANVGRAHPDYGMALAEHAASKYANNLGKRAGY